MSTTVFGEESTQQVDVILVETYFVYINGIAFLVAKQSGENEAFYFIVEECFSELDGYLDMVEAFRYIVVPIPHSIFGADVWGARHVEYCTPVYAHSSLCGAQGVLGGGA